MSSESTDVELPHRIAERFTAVTSRSRPQFNWTFLFMWVGASVVGELIVSIFRAFAFSISPTANNPWELILSIAVAALVGAVIGGAQGFVLAYHFAQTKFFKIWIGLTAGGYAVGTLLSIIVPSNLPVLAGVLLGLVVGSAQWLILKQYVRLAGVWIVASIVAFVTGVLGILITGLVMMWLLNRPKQQLTESMQPSV